MADFDRYRSFCERYIIARASQFRAGQEREDAWNASLDALSIYRRIEMQSRDVDRPPQQAGVSAAPQISNMVAAHQDTYAKAMSAGATARNAKPYPGVRTGVQPINSNSWAGGKK